MLPDAGIALAALTFAASSVALLIRHVFHGVALRLVVIDP
jgi:hypothetical protein